MTDNKIMGFGLSILSWLLLALVYDGLQLFILSQLDNYPLEKSDFNQAKIKSYNIISDLSEKARLIYYSEFFMDVSEKVN